MLFNGKCDKCGSQTGKTKTGRHKKYCDLCEKEVQRQINYKSSAKYYKKNHKKKRMVLKCPIGAVSLRDALLKGVECIPLSKLFERRVVV